MVDILVKVVSAGSALAGCYGKGHPVCAKALPFNWGGCEGLPDFVKVRITDSNDPSGWDDAWYRKTLYEILAHDPVQDFFRVRIYCQDTVKVVTKSAMEEFLLNWGAEQITDDNGVVFEITAMDGIEGKGLFSFGADDDIMVYTETAYDATAGTHTVELDFSLSQLPQKQIESILAQGGMDIVSMDFENGKCVFIGTRSKMIATLEQQVRQRFDTMIARTRWRFPDSVVDAALANGGVIEYTEAEADATMIDVAEEV